MIGMSSPVFPRPTEPATMDAVTPQQKDHQEDARQDRQPGRQRDEPQERTAERTAEPLTQHVQRLTQRVRAFDRRHPLLWDLHLTGCCVTVALIDYLGGGWRNIARSTDAPGWLLLVITLGFSVPLLWRRTHPRTVLLSMAPVALANAWTGAVLQAALLQLIVIHNIALRRPLRSLWWAAALMITPVAVAAAHHPKGSWDQQIVPQFLTIALVAVVGVTVRTRRNYTEVLEDRARRLEVERDQQARLAAAAERTRIAREMHDIIGHNLSVITGLADGGSYAAARSPERAAQALKAIGTTSRQALTELRRLLDVLREDDPTAERTPQPTLADLPDLIEGVRAAGLPVSLTTHGRPALPPGRELTVYRVVQESLTNSLKHAGPKAASTVSLSYGPATDVTLTITDTGSPPPVPPTDGRGLPGMRERTALYGGTLEAGPLPAPDHGWRVRLHLPPEEPPQ
jgi:signal transduction histidine kinase